MAMVKVFCPKCNSDNILKNGKSSNKKQRYLCKNESCSRQTFILECDYNGLLPDVKKKIIEMAMNGSGVRDTARVLNVSTATVINELKKKESELQFVNEKLLNTFSEEDSIEVDIVKVDEAEMDEMWSFIFKKENQHWLWHAIDHETGKVLAYSFGKRKDEVFLSLKNLLEPFNVKKFYTDDWGSYSRHLPTNQHEIGKKNTQKIERKHLTFRTRIKRLARKTICFSKTIQMHNIVIGLFINRYEFDLAI